MTQCLALLLQLLRYVFLLALLLLRKGKYPAHNLFLAPIRHLVETLIELAADLTQSVVEFQVHLVGSCGNGRFLVVHLSDKLLHTIL